MATSRFPRPEFCADEAAERAEPLHATASRVDHWLLVEYRGVWAPDPLAGSSLSAAVKRHLADQLDALPRSRLLFIRRPDRRQRPGLACFYARTSERDPTLHGRELESDEDLAGLELDVAADGWRPLDHSLFLVCTHGKRDRCCARYGRPLYDALCEIAEEDRVWQATHVGGDRFAGNLLCFPEGLYFGRVGPGVAWRVLDEYLSGRIALDRYRGRCCYPFAVQAAEIALRERTGALGLDDVRLLAIERAGREWRVSLAAGDTAHELKVLEERAELAYLTCSASAMRHAPRFVVRDP